MWSTALGINTCVWTVSGVFLVYSTGTLVLHGSLHQFLWAALIFTLSNFAGAAIATQA